MAGKRPLKRWTMGNVRGDFQGGAIDVIAPAHGKSEERACRILIHVTSINIISW